MIKGDITRFSPGDLLTFLSHLNQEGVLTVTREDQGLTIYFRRGFLIAAHSEQADSKVLGSLCACGLVNPEQYSDLDLARRETGLPLRQILQDSGTLDLNAAEPVLRTGIHEVIFQLFTWGTGDFQFNEVSLEQFAGEQVYDCNGLAMEAARQVDEYREFLRNVASEELVLFRTEAGQRVSECPDEIRFVLHWANGEESVRQVLQAGPFTSFAVMKAIEEAAKKQWIELRPGQSSVSEPATEPVGEGPLFLSYKGSVLKVIQAKDKQQQVSVLINYCRDHFDKFILFSLNGSTVERCVRFQRDETGRRLGIELPNPECGLQSDPTFRFVCESRSPFFGRSFISPLLKGLGEPDPTDGCAIIPLGGKGEKNSLLYVCADGDTQIPGPLHYLEMISWQIHPPRQDEKTANPTAAQAAATSQTAGPDKATTAATMVAAVNELPPMPHVVTQVMELLSDPNSQMSDMVAVLARDPALVARLIRVSNSALYGRGEETTSLGQAVVRLGANTVRSLVMAAAMKSLFPLDKTNIGVWGQALWQHSIECGLASRRVAQVAGSTDPEEAFVAGVLHDVGKVVILLHKPEEYRLILKRQTADREGCAAAERAVLGFDHTEVGLLLLKKWQMPGNLQACVRYHHDPAGADKDQRLAKIIAVGNFLSHAFGSQPDTALDKNFFHFEQVCAELNISPDRSQALLEEIGSSLEHSNLLD